MGQITVTTEATRELLRQPDIASVRDYLGVYSEGEISSILLGYQAADTDLSAIASLSTTSFGRSFLTLADAAAARSLIGTGSVAWNDITGKPTTIAGYGITNALTTSEIVAGYQPLDADLTAIAALSTTSYGRGLLTLANQAALQTAHGVTTDGQSDQVFSETITWTGTTAPSGTATLRYEWERIGKKVTVRFRFEWTTAGTGITRANFLFPSGIPAPRALTGEGNSEISFGLSGVMTATTALGSGVNSTAVDTRVQRDSSGNPEVWIRASATAVNGIIVNGEYLCA